MLLPPAQMILFDNIIKYMGKAVELFSGRKRFFGAPKKKSRRKKKMGGPKSYLATEHHNEAAPEKKKKKKAEVFPLGWAPKNTRL